MKLDLIFKCLIAYFHKISIAKSKIIWILNFNLKSYCNIKYELK